MHHAGVLGSGSLTLSRAIIAVESCLRQASAGCPLALAIDLELLTHIDDNINLQKTRGWDGRSYT